MPDPDSARSSALGQNGRVKSRSKIAGICEAVCVLSGLGHLPRVGARLIRNQQIRKALELLTPPPGERAECEQDISVALNKVEHGAAAARYFRVTASKKGKAGLKRYYAALRRLRSAYNSLDPAIKPWFSL